MGFLLFYYYSFRSWTRMLDCWYSFEFPSVAHALSLSHDDIAAAAAAAAATTTTDDNNKEDTKNETIDQQQQRPDNKGEWTCHCIDRPESGIPSSSSSSSSCSSSSSSSQYGFVVQGPLEFLQQLIPKNNDNNNDDDNNNNATTAFSSSTKISGLLFKCGKQIFYVSLTTTTSTTMTLTKTTTTTTTTTSELVDRMAIVLGLDPKTVKVRQMYCLCIYMCVCAGL